MGAGNLTAVVPMSMTTVWRDVPRLTIPTNFAFACCRMTDRAENDASSPPHPF
jgi:hypothetical protein